jgi:histidinol-phosphate aminotransferase
MTGAVASGRLPGPRADVALIEGYHSPQLDVAVRLNTNECAEPPPPGFSEALARELTGISLNRYPDRSVWRLRAAVAEHEGVAPEQVFCANGSNEVLQALLLAYGGPDRAVATFEPTYALHAHIARITGTEVISGERDEDFLIGAGALAAVLEEGARRFGSANPVVTFLCSPNNPTGRLEPVPIVDEVLASAPGLVVVDEAYGQFAATSAIARLGEHPNLVVVRTFSKTWSLAAVRLGYLVADPEVVETVERVTLPYHLGALAQAAGMVALRFDAEMRERVARIVAERERVVAGLAALGAWVCPSDANFVLFRPTGHDARAVWDGLVSRSVLVRDVSAWPGLAGCLRVTVGTPEENDAFLAALGAVLQ